jgi:hypothetical protein
MAKALVRFCVAIADGVVGIVLGAVVVCKLDDAFAVGPVIAVRGSLGTIVCEETKVELGIGVLDLVDLFHTKELVELDRALWILDTDPAGC